MAIPRFADPEKERAAVLVYWANLAVLLCSPLVAVLGFRFARRGAWLAFGAALVAWSVTLWSYWLLRRGYVQIASALLCLVTLVLVTAGGLLGASMRPVVAGGYVVVIFLAGLLTGWQGAVASGLLSLVSSLGLYATSMGEGDLALSSGVALWGDLALMGGVVAATTLMAVCLARRFSTWEVPIRGPESVRVAGGSDLDRQIESLSRRLDLLRGAIGLSSHIGFLSERDEIARQAVALVSELFPVEWAGLFLCEACGAPDGGALLVSAPQIVLVASAGRVEASLGLPGERFELSASPALARCVRKGELVVTETRELGLGTPTEVLAPRVGAVLLLPMRAEGNVLGVLALHREPTGASDSGYVDAAQVAAEQVAVALHRARIHASLRSAATLAERAVQRHVESSWSAVEGSQSQVSGYRYTPRRAWADERAWLAPMADAVRESRLVTAGMSSEVLLAAPLVQSGVVIGAVGLRRAADHPWTEEEKLLVQSVSEQVTQALENRRLFEFARDRAQRERVLRRITERMRAQADLDGAIAAAAEQMREITGATHVAIRLAQPRDLDDTAHAGERRLGDGA